MRMWHCALTLLDVVAVGLQEGGWGCGGEQNAPRTRHATQQFAFLRKMTSRIAAWIQMHGAVVVVEENGLRVTEGQREEKEFDELRRLVHVASHSHLFRAPFPLVEMFARASLRSHRCLLRLPLMCAIVLASSISHRAVCWRSGRGRRPFLFA